VPSTKSSQAPPETSLPLPFSRSHFLLSLSLTSIYLFIHFPFFSILGFELRAFPLT
jgi:hypothetical protein